MSESHPLFPAANEHDDPPEVTTIHVQRIPDGTHYRAFSPEELTSYQQIFEMFGGGQYVLLARNGARITGRATVTLPGKSKPLNPTPPADDEDDDDPRVVMMQPQQPAQPSSDPAILIAVMNMMQANQNNMMQLMMKQGESQTQVMMAMMQQGNAGSREFIQNMQALHDRHSQEQAKLMATILEASRQNQPGGGSGEMGGFMRGLEFAKQFATGGDDESELGEVFETLKPFLDGVNAVQPPADGDSDD